MGALRNSKLRDEKEKVRFFEKKGFRLVLEQKELIKIKAILKDACNEQLLKELEVIPRQTAETAWFEHCHAPSIIRKELSDLIAACQMIQESLGNWIGVMPSFNEGGYTTDDIQYVSELKKTLGELQNIYELTEKQLTGKSKRGNSYDTYLRLLVGSVIFAFDRHGIVVSSHYEAANGRPSLIIQVIGIILKPVGTGRSNKNISNLILDFRRNVHGNGLGSTFRSPA